RLVQTRQQDGRPWIIPEAVSHPAPEVLEEGGSLLADDLGVNPQRRRKLYRERAFSPIPDRLGIGRAVGGPNRLEDPPVGRIRPAEEGPELFEGPPGGSFDLDDGAIAS